MEDLEDTEDKHKVGYDWCVDENGNELKIENVQKGKHQYYCGDCRCRMIARKGEVRADHFAHDATDVVRYGNCEATYMTYAHKVASDILQRLKYVKVPAIRKYPPSGVEGKAMILQNSENIMAHRVENEMQFYEDSNGKMSWGKRIDFTEDKTKYFLIKPDTSFFNSNDKPILLIEIHVTHEVKEDKIIKIQHLGIDTIEIKIARYLNSEEIEKVITSASNTLWIFNHERESTKYIPAKGTPEQSGSPINEFERRISESGESFKCRKSQINNVIRGIRKYMESSEFGVQEGSLDLETEQFEQEKEEFDTRFNRLQNQAEEELRIEFEERRRAIDSRRAEINKRIRELADNKENLVERYNRKKRDIANFQTEYRAECQSEIEQLEGKIEEHKIYDESYDGVVRNFESEEKRIGEETIRIKESYFRESSDREGKLRPMRREKERLDSEESCLPGEYEKIERELRAEFEGLEKSERKQYTEIFGGAIDSIRNRNTTKIPKFKQHFEGFFTAEGFFADFINEEKQYERLRKAKQHFDAKSYKDWI